MKTCSRCQTEKPLESFHKRSARKSGYASHCKDCDSLRTKVWREDNPEKAAARFTRWKLANPERAVERVKEWKQEHPEETREQYRRKSRKRRAQIDATKEHYTEAQLFEAYGTSCHICLTSIDLDAPRSTGVEGWEKGLHIDHLIPLSKGGNDTLDNVRPSHGQCNLRKASTIIE